MSISELNERYWLKEARSVIHASGTAHLCTVEDAAGRLFITWSHDMKNFCKPFPASVLRREKND